MLTSARLRELLHYDPSSGEFRWRQPVGRYGRIPIGSLAGGVSPEGYRYIWIDGTLYRASRLAVLYMTGKWPKDQVDHRNRKPADDRWENLREATQSQNKANSSLYSNNTTGMKGVYFDPSPGRAAKPWRAKAKVNGKRQWLGRFATKKEAYAAYCAAVKNEYGDFAST